MRHDPKAHDSHVIIIRDDVELKISITEFAIKLKEDTLAIAGLIGRVTNAEENKRAVMAQAALNDLVKLVEKARKESKDPVLVFGRQIDTAAKEFVYEPTQELMRVSELLGNFQALESARVRAAETVRRLEVEKLEADKKAEQQAIIDSQRAEDVRLTLDARQAHERLLAANNAQEREAARIAQAEIEKQKALAAAKSHEALDAVQEHFSRQQADLTVPQAVRTEGQIIKGDWEVEVVDIDLLARCHRNCVEIKPRLSEIKELLKLGVEVKGIRATPIVKSAVRAGNGGKTIQV